jgi:hypothetical protein
MCPPRAVRCRPQPRARYRVPDAELPDRTSGSRVTWFAGYEDPRPGIHPSRSTGSPRDEDEFQPGAIRGFSNHFDRKPSISEGVDHFSLAAKSQG